MCVFVVKEGIWDEDAHMRVEYVAEERSVMIQLVEEECLHVVNIM
jgi:hypothetical protein